MERIREVKVTVEIDTNKRTIKETYTLGSEEGIDELLKRAETDVVAIFEELA